MIAYLTILCGLLATSWVVADQTKDEPPEVEVEVRFIEVAATAANSATLEWLLQDSWDQGTEEDVLTSKGLAKALNDLECSGSADVLSASKVRTRSGTSATFRAGTECRYPTSMEVRHISVTNGADIVSSVTLIPGDFISRHVGTALDVTPEYCPENNMIDLEILAEVVSEPIWKDYPVKYEGADGESREFSFEQPFFHKRGISPEFSIYNGSTILMGGMITTRKAHVEGRVPVLGSIPWLGRLFRSDREVEERINLLISITARTLDNDH